ncbi:PSME3-interacting protein isoform X2 [Neocloeon triangulifer]|uniref:PSME3-interacting protein isoform X2 n=1 Tax=Neocloeon triangulifer TaxID=2078957 RepID=UPI00286F18EA|nr:PSME3-interacting protein isoform X2 [Neocloeon triangulifer]
MSSGFVTESEVEEQKKKRQEEWERVRKPDDPKEAPEEAYDPRCLFERLQEQKMKKDMEFEEAHKLKNMIKGLDDDEINFLDQVDKGKIEAEKRKNLEEEQAIAEYRNAVSSLQDDSLQARINLEVIKKPVTGSSSTTSAKLSQHKLLAGAVKRKSSDMSNSAETQTGAKRKHSETEETLPTPVMTCIGILPGIGNYHDSSDSEHSSNTDEDS